MRECDPTLSRCVSNPPCMFPIGAQPRGPRLLRQGGLETRPYKNLNPLVCIIDPEFCRQLDSFEPIVQRTVGPFSKLTFKTAFAAQTRQITCPRSRNDKPRRRDFAVLDNFGTLKHEGALASAQFSAESLHADERRRSIIPQDL